MVLTLSANGEYASLDLPTSVTEAQEATAELMTGDGSVEIADVGGPIHNLTQYVRHGDPKDEAFIHGHQTMYRSAPLPKGFIRSTYHSHTIQQ